LPVASAGAIASFSLHTGSTNSDSNPAAKRDT